MKYKSITLNGNKEYLYSLVKYTDEYKRQLEEFRKINSEMADSVENGPKIFSDQSDHQSYMIVRGRYYCVGAIIIGTSCDEKNLELQVQFNEKYLNSTDDIYTIVDQIVDSLGLYFYDKKEIEIEILNNVDLSKYNKFKYSKKVYDEKLTTYICSNYENKLIPAIINEMKETEDKLTEWKQFWFQKFNMSSYPDVDYEFDGPLLEDYERGSISTDEMFFKADSISWHGITSTKSTRNIDFYRDGKIHFNKDSKKLNGINYDFDYHVLGDWFKFKTCGFFNDCPLKIDDNNYYTKISIGNLSVLNCKDNHRKRINFVTPNIKDSSIEVELWENDENEIERCYIDFRTHKGNGKVNGVYALRIMPEYNIFKLNFISRDGFRYRDFSKQVNETSEELYTTILEGNLTYELIDEIIKKIIPIINRNAINLSRKTIAIENDNIISNMIDIENQAKNFVKQIKGEIPLPHLQKNIENFIDNNQIKKDKVKKLLKK